MDTWTMANIAYKALDDKKGIDITLIDIRDISVIADYFLIAGGRSDNQVQAMADAVEEALEKAGARKNHVEGYRSAKWILMDYKDLVIHIFNQEDRLFYDLERIWRDGKVVEPDINTVSPEQADDKEQKQ